MRLRYDGACRVCDVELPQGTMAVYERASRSVRCLEHDDGAAPAEKATPLPGTPGASARREYERRQDARARRIREAHPKLGGAILALSDDPQSTRAGDTGASGEEQLGARLNEAASETCRLLHDRRVPGTRANIDHVAVTPSGVYIIDAKKYQGRPTSPRGGRHTAAADRTTDGRLA